MKFYKDNECRLLDVLIHIADWDKKHKETFGTTGESLRDIKKHYLPEWSTGKLSAVRKKLVKHSDIAIKDDGRIEVKNFWRFVSPDVQKVEQAFQSDEQDVQQDEQSVQPAEQIRNTENHDALVKNQLETTQNTPVVQPTEHQKDFKETLNKLKETQTNIDMLIKKYGNDINVPIKNYCVEQVSEAAKITEARIGEGENIRNKIGCITNLCKEGAKWEGSEWQLKESQRKIREEEERRKLKEMTQPITSEQRARINLKMKEIRKKMGWG